MKNILTSGLNKYYLPERIKTTITNNLQNRQRLDNLNRTQSRWKLRTFYFNSIKKYVSRPVVKITRKSVNIYLFYYSKKSRLNRNIINNLGEIITRLYIKPVQLRLI
jgi:hypothetical protein